MCGGYVTLVRRVEEDDVDRWSCEGERNAIYIGQKLLDGGELALVPFGISVFRVHGLFSSLWSHIFIFVINDSVKSG